VEVKIQLRIEMVQKTYMIVFQLGRQEQYIRENVLIYGAEEDNEDDGSCSQQQMSSKMMFNLMIYKERID